jgi:hypothetical protein
MLAYNILSITIQNSINPSKSHTVNKLSVFHISTTVNKRMNVGSGSSKGLPTMYTFPLSTAQAHPCLTKVTEHKPRIQGERRGLAISESGVTHAELR